MQLQHERTASQFEGLGDLIYLFKEVSEIGAHVAQTFLSRNR